MKHWKKLLVVVAAVVMAMAMTVPAYAAKVSMNISEGDTHEYKVYQIYVGDVSTDGKTLSNVKYGNSGYGTAGEAVPTTELEGITNADTFARSIAAQATHEVGTLKAGTTEINNLAPGYYLVVDDTEKGLVAGDAYSAYIVEILGDEAITPKKNTSTDDKTITSDTLGKDDATTTVNGKVDNVSVGDTVNFTITGTVPSHATDYDYYFFIIGDTLSNGLTFNPTSIAVSASTKGALTADEDYALYQAPNADGKTFQVALVNAKALAGQTITVTYSATLNQNAVIGENANTNTVTIEYSNNPNHNYNGDKDNNTPGKPASESHAPLGTTPGSTTQTYTTGIQIKKVDQDGKVLTGAAFTLTGDNEEIVLVSSEQFTVAADGTYYKLKNDTYTDEAPIENDYMKQADAGATAGYVEAEANYQGDDAKEVGGTTYRPYNSTTDAGKTVYILVEANVDLYDNPDTKYEKTVSYTQKDTNTEGVTATAEVGPDGVVIFNGLGQGTYTITESTTPNGYNTISPISVAISFTATPATGAHHWSTNTEDVTYNAATGDFELTVENNAGTELPSTGGMGTTILYIIGGIMVLLAVVFLITKKRVAATKKDVPDDIL